jgi:hypothetical protein
MIEGIRTGLKEEILARAGRLGKSAVSQSILISRFHLFHFVGLVLVGLAFSASAQLVATKVDVAVYAASGGGPLSAVATGVAENDRLPSEMKTLSNEPNTKVPERNAESYPSIGVALVCGLALFLWVQRFRNSLG